MTSLQKFTHQQQCYSCTNLYGNVILIRQAFACFIDGTVLTVTTGRDGTVKPSSKWNRGPVPSTVSPTVNSYRPVPSRKSLPLHFTVPSRRGNIPLPSRPVDKTCPYRPVPSTKPTPTVPSRRQNLPIPSRPAVETCPYRQTPPSKPVPAVPRRHSLPAVTPSRRDAVNTI